MNRKLGGEVTTAACITCCEPGRSPIIVMNSGNQSERTGERIMTPDVDLRSTWQEDGCCCDRRIVEMKSGAKV